MTTYTGTASEVEIRRPRKGEDPEQYKRDKKRAADIDKNVTKLANSLKANIHIQYPSKSHNTVTGMAAGLAYYGSLSTLATRKPNLDMKNYHIARTTLYDHPRMITAKNAKGTDIVIGHVLSPYTHYIDGLYSDDDIVSIFSTVFSQLVPDKAHLYEVIVLGNDDNLYLPGSPKCISIVLIDHERLDYAAHGSPKPGKPNKTYTAEIKTVTTEDGYIRDELEVCIDGEPVNSAYVLDGDNILPLAKFLLDGMSTKRISHDWITWLNPKQELLKKYRMEEKSRY